jgi:hypothetical protein
VERDTALVPELGAVGLLGDQLLVQPRGGLSVLTQQVDFGHRLRHQATILAALQGEGVFLERLVVVALLPEGQTQVEMGQGATGNRRRLRIGHRRFDSAFERQVRLGAA